MNKMNFCKLRRTRFDELVNHFRQFYYKPLEQHAKTTSSGLKQLNWTDPSDGVYPLNKSFPLRGNIGLSESYLNKSGNAEAATITTTTTTPAPMTNVSSIPRTVIMEYEYLKQDTGCTADFQDSDILECIVQSCPETLKNLFNPLFHDRDIMNDIFTVITISQKTENDMATFNSTVKKEREGLHKSFMEGAKIISNSLKEVGFWADYLDTSTGKLFGSPHPHEVMLETDERYRYLGFDIEDIICCYVISHHKWGTHSYVGCLFTNLPPDHPVLKTMEHKTMTGKTRS
ncbi:cobalamin trafficking protein CblD isoform X2 [Octopus bimaculoides]|uniref:Methylmalonic aciduria and homocystinuria type D protein, mitochondrial n=2 Tax=Octopus bimaculoides TaxID=37653 RepID=A0A0L8GFR1_OCTBM|nr:cobalamin trafficking protein CblD isoform X2 [Octopus bimaculoides]|eukprot:XP_014781559.1 PREDICTED: methylmalonic aciduria and homocystinuria type D protein, mitochondrial-like isoform X2 [Octopus bimaculoides]